ncbi:hypothetical protein M422DRAFT_256253 [Sphaerobolus stellatus SS14]|uniref:DUF6533 domain-containing protein n=1 Tax=Sphaerobolus stellatus (strain SS14) TaxID=990650 RepID=A0A0C9V187_SPHS4|nr:hypothetical protein M422DRAFT_256253 [Sphaerobolus stellatus SS14]
MIININGAAAREAEWVRMAYLASAVVITYEHVLGFEHELQFFWMKRWSAAKTLFLWNRYYGLTFNVTNAVFFLWNHPSENVSPMQRELIYDSNKDVYKLWVLIYKSQHILHRDADVSYQFISWLNAGATLQTVSIHLILQLRIWAMWGSTKTVLIAMVREMPSDSKGNSSVLQVLLALFEALALGVSLGAPKEKLIVTSQPFPGVFICTDIIPPNSPRWPVFYYAVILITEMVLLCMALYKARLYRVGPLGRRGLLQELVRHSVFYFMAIFWIYAVNLGIWVVNRSTLNELATSFSLVLPLILANRLLITTKVTHASSLPSTEDTHLSSRHFRRFFMEDLEPESFELSTISAS